jgi:DegV family protein with EDD domain
MSIKIVADSSCDLTEDMRKKMNIELAPLTLYLGEKVFVDDDNLDVRNYIKEMAECEVSPKSACPSPDDFMKRYAGDESIFAVTLSAAVSGTYSSAVLAKNMFTEEVGDKFIHVFDSLSASVGETLVALKIHELSKLNLDEPEIVERVSEYIKGMKTLFLLQSLEHLAKAGRLNPFVAKVATMLGITPIMGVAEDGSIKLIEKVRGYKKAFRRLVESIGEQGKELEERVLGISHCNCLDRALELKEEVMKKYKFKDIIIVEMGGLSSTYADNGGIIIAF